MWIEEGIRIVETCYLEVKVGSFVITSISQEGYIHLILIKHS